MEVVTTKKTLLQYGDFQTPLKLVNQSVAYIKSHYHYDFKTIIEPICGMGSFLLAAADAFSSAQHVLGAEVNADYVDMLRELIVQRKDKTRFAIYRQNFFTIHWQEMLARYQPLFLIIGNPPWVTNSAIGSFCGDNLPQKSNVNGELGFASWKVAISGFYKQLNFQVIGPVGGKPVIFDDTVYFLSVGSEEFACFLAGLLNSLLSQDFLSSMIFWSDKRPITMNVLKRMDLMKLSQFLGQKQKYCAMLEKSVNKES